VGGKLLRGRVQNSGAALLGLAARAHAVQVRRVTKKSSHCY
jgi:hypothetical protein